MSSGASDQYETPFGAVELRAAHTQVEQHSHDVPLALGFRDLGQVLEAAVHDPGPFAEASECLLRRRHRHRIPVDAEEPEVGPSVERGPPARPPPPVVWRR